MQDAVLHGAGVRRGDELLAVGIFFDGHEGVIIVPCRVAFGEVQRAEHVVVVVNLARFYRHEAHAVEDVEDGL